MVFPLSKTQNSSQKHNFENILFKKISFHFWTCYADDTFTLIDTFLHKIDYILQIPSTIISNLNIKLKTMMYSFFLIYWFPALMKASQHLSIAKMSLFPFLHMLILTIQRPLLYFCLLHLKYLVRLYFNQH